jgi:hypothetical protein
MVIKDTQKRESKKEPDIGYTEGRLNVKTIKAEKDPNHNRNQMMALPDMNHILRYTQRMLWARGSIQFQLSGGIDSADGRMQSEVDRRTQRMRAGYFRLAGRVFENHRLSLKTRTQIFKAVVIPAALYDVRHGASQNNK